jgi:hypothetical protein
VAAAIIQGLSRAQLKEFLAALRREVKRRAVYVAVAGEPDIGAVGDSMAGHYAGREIQVARDDGLGAGVRVRAGDDIVDASVRGYIRSIIDELGGT